jgi:hypothetical protein
MGLAHLLDGAATGRDHSQKVEVLAGVGVVQAGVSHVVGADEPSHAIRVLSENCSA